MLHSAKRASKQRHPLLFRSTSLREFPSRVVQLLLCSMWLGSFLKAMSIFFSASAQFVSSQLHWSWWETVAEMLQSLVKSCYFCSAPLRGLPAEVTKTSLFKYTTKFLIAPEKGLHPKLIQEIYLEVKNQEDCLWQGRNGQMPTEHVKNLYRNA